MTFTDDLREEAARHHDPTAGMLTAAAWHIDQADGRVVRLVTDLARALGVSEAAIRVRYGMETPSAVVPVRIPPRPEPETVGWYTTDGWETRDDAHRWTAFVDRDQCPHGPHRGPEGPNEDLSQCPTCLSPSWTLRPENEQIGLHADDCSLPRRHEGYCVGGGTGHAPTEVIRGYWLGMDDDVRAARERHGGVA